MIRFEDVSFRYETAAPGVFALRGLSLTVGPGEMLAVLGANGSGKSTLARLANGLLLPSSGHVTVDGIATTDPQMSFRLRASVGMVFQHADDQIVATSVEDDVAFGPENLGLPREQIRERVDAAIADVGLSGLERREPHLLSGGQKQRLAIAGALAMRPRYLVLDEPTSMIDAQGRHEVSGVLANVRASGRAVLLITHEVAEAASADRVVVLAEGERAFEGTPAALLQLGDAPLAEWGLELPAVGVLGARLRALGVQVPLDAMTPESIGEALWR